MQQETKKAWETLSLWILYLFLKAKAWSGTKSVAKIGGIMLTGIGLFCWGVYTFRDVISEFLEK